MKKLLPIIISVVVVGSGAFYGGMVYGQSKNSSGNFNQNNFANFQNLTPKQRQQRFEQMGGGAGRVGIGQSGSSISNGEIISKDDKSMTVKLRDGGSKIIFYSDTTQITKFASSTPKDLQVGEQITANGSANSDGSITAQSIQVRPNIINP